MCHSWRSNTDCPRRSPSFNILKYPSTVHQQQQHSIFLSTSIFLLVAFFYCPLHAIAFIRIRYRTITSEVCGLIAKQKKKNFTDQFSLSLCLSLQHNDFPGALSLLRARLTKTTRFEKTSRVETNAVMQTTSRHRLRNVERKKIPQNHAKQTIYRNWRIYPPLDGKFPSGETRYL